MRALAVALALAAFAAPGAARAGAGAAADLVVYWAPEPSPAAAAAHDALAARARGAGIALLDLTPAAAPPPLAPGLHRRAVEAYEALRFDEALVALEAAIADAGQTGAAGLSPSSLSDLFLYRGLTHTQRGDDARAWDDLVRAAALAPARVLDPLRFPSRAVEAFQRAHARVQAGPRGELSVAAPSGCAMAIDGADAPAGTASLPYGEHFVRVVCPGRRPWANRLDLAAPAQRLAAAPVTEAPPDDAALRQLGRSRGAAAVAVVLLAVADGAPPTLSARLLEVDSGRVVARASAALAPGPAGAAEAAAALAQVLAPPAPPPPSAPGRRWYERRWVWATVGALTAAALLLPLTGGESAPEDVVLRPTGFTW